ncbi:hypothetical protein J2S17_003308 [Cytobacillus purgationiresistens]|uniref:Uncharacterized protein n=1 Tax=Cytobacillus purgationiresistens TaxID=863449 RepID=A0ABU0AJH4_9BACI|nr:hypothetical protein [Cytobacillus purgationiresistens]
MNDGTLPEQDTPECIPPSRKERLEQLAGYTSTNGQKPHSIDTTCESAKHINAIHSYG